MRSATSNSDVIRTCESKIRESGRTIGWFEESLRELEGRRQGAGAGGAGERSLPPTPREEGAERGEGGEREREKKDKVAYTSLGECRFGFAWEGRRGRGDRAQCTAAECASDSN